MALVVVGADLEMVRVLRALGIAYMRINGRVEAVMGEVEADAARTMGARLLKLCAGYRVAMGDGPARVVVEGGAGESG